MLTDNYTYDGEHCIMYIIVESHVVHLKLIYVNYNSIRKREKIGTHFLKKIVSTIMDICRHSLFLSEL